MSRTINLRNSVTSLLETIINEVHYMSLDGDVPYPYVSYELKEVFSRDEKTVFNLEVNVLDYGSDSTVVEIASDDIQKLFDKYYYIDDRIQFSIYKLTRSSFEEEDKNIQRRILTFELHFHEREE